MKINLFPIEAGQLRSGFDLTCNNIFKFLNRILFKTDVVYHHLRLENNPFQVNSEILRSNKLFASSILEQLNSKNFVLNIGGDHTMALGSVKAFLDYTHKTFPSKPKKVIWFDAHADINTRVTSFSGNMHGMPLSFLTNLDSDPFLFPLERCLNFQELVYIGAREFDDFELEVINKHKIPIFPQIKGYENEILQKIGINNIVHISFDVDCLDPTQMYATGTKSYDGLFLDDCLSIIDNIHKKNTILSADIAEYNEKAHTMTDLESQISWNTMRQLILTMMSLG